jgi:hypothetical protein
MISGMSVALVNSFIFEMIFCKRPTKKAPKAMADDCDICTNRCRSVTVTRRDIPDNIGKAMSNGVAPHCNGSRRYDRSRSDDRKSEARRSLIQ